MERSGLRETISTREKSFALRSRMCGSVSGKFIIVPRINASAGQKLSEWYHRGRTTHIERIPDFKSGWRGEFSLQKASISESMQLTAEVRVRARGGMVSDLPVYGCCFFSALRDSQVGSGQKESVSEEALRRKSSVFRYGR